MLCGLKRHYKYCINPENYVLDNKSPKKKLTPKEQFFSVLNLKTAKTLEKITSENAHDETLNEFEPFAGVTFGRLENPGN
jgi:hypothetical protein